MQKRHSLLYRYYNLRENNSRIWIIKRNVFFENSLRIFQFASKPTMKTMDGDFIFCDNFVKEYKPFRRIEKKEMNNYQNYQEILQSERTFENLKLLNFIKSEIKFLQS